MKNNSNVVDIGHWRRESRQQVLERLFYEHGPALRSFLRARVTSDADLDDVVQDVFVRLADMENFFDNLSPVSGSNRSLILTTANNMVKDLERRRAVRSQYNADHKEEADGQIEEVSPEQIAEDSQQLELVHRAIQAMRPNWRRVLILNRFHNMTYRQIADEMNVSVKQIEKYMSNALGVIRDAIQREANRGGQRGGHLGGKHNGQ